jgi:hypothetical protein
MRRTPLLPAMVVVALLAGCTSNGTARPESSPTAVATQDATTAATATISPTEQARALLDQLVAAVIAHDADAVLRMVHLTRTPCTERTGIGGPPKCWSNGTNYKEGNVPPEGTLFDVLPYSSCELGWYQGAMLVWLIGFDVERAGELYATVRLTRPLVDAIDANYPTASHAALFTQRVSAGQPESSIVFAVDDRGITFIDHPCIQSAAAALANHPIYRDAIVLTKAPAFGR